MQLCSSILIYHVLGPQINVFLQPAYIAGSLGGDGELVAGVLERGVTWHPV